MERKYKSVDKYFEPLVLETIYLEDITDIMVRNNYSKITYETDDFKNITELNKIKKPYNQLSIFGKNNDNSVDVDFSNKDIRLYSPNNNGQSETVIYDIEKYLNFKIKESKEIHQNIKTIESKVIMQNKKSQEIPQNIKTKKSFTEEHLKTIMVGLIITVLGGWILHQLTKDENSNIIKKEIIKSKKEIDIDNAINLSIKINHKKNKTDLEKKFLKDLYNEIIDQGYINYPFNEAVKFIIIKRYTNKS